MKIKLTVGKSEAFVTKSGKWVSSDQTLQTYLNLNFGALLYPVSPSDGVQFSRQAEVAALRLGGTVEHLDVPRQNDESRVY